MGQCENMIGKIVTHQKFARTFKKREREREREISLGYWLKEPEEIVSNYWQREYKKLHHNKLSSTL
jgi:hypothetical protein